MSTRIILLAIAFCTLMSAVVSQTTQGSQGGFHRGHVYECCKQIPQLVTKDSKDKCFPQRQQGSQGYSHHGGHNWTCVAECVWKNQNLVTAANVVDQTALQTAINALATQNPTFSTVFTGAFNNCTANPVSVPATATCKSGAGQLSHCLRHYIMVNCPASARSNSTQCTAFFSKISQG